MQRWWRSNSSVFRFSVQLAGDLNATNAELDGADGPDDLLVFACERVVVGEGEGLEEEVADGALLLRGAWEVVSGQRERPRREGEDQ